MNTSSIKSLSIALLVSLATGLGMTLLSLLGLTILDLYLSGHSMTTLNEIKIGPSSYQIGIDNVLFLLIPLSSMVATFVLVIKTLNPKTNP